MKAKEEFNKEKYSKEWHPSKTEALRIDPVLKLIGRNKKVLDIGCYEGTISKCIADNNNEVYGIDISESAVKLAKEKGIDARVVDVEEEELPFSDGFFDVVAVAEVIEHIFDTDGFLEKIKRVIKKDGYLVLTTPNLASFGRRLLLLFGKNPLIEVTCDRESAGHTRYFIHDTLATLLRTHGFKVDVFLSDVVNFNARGTLHSTSLARICPALGRTLIIKASLSNQNNV